jgi:hypothetical protein
MHIERKTTATHRRTNFNNIDFNNNLLCHITHNNITMQNTRLYSRGSNSGFSVKKKCPLAGSQLEKCRMVNPKKCRIVTPQRWTAFSRGQEDFDRFEEIEEIRISY